MDKLTGREPEILLLQKALKEKEAQLIAVYGRRRIGKTFLVKSVYADHLVFEFSGVHHAGLGTQLQNFSFVLQKAMESVVPLAAPPGWVMAFQYLQNFLEPLVTKRKCVIFFDEFPWIHTPRSGFLQAFEHFWNSWATTKKNLVVVICGSAASWMIRNIVNNKGGLHNRITQRIRLLPFTLFEMETYLKTRGVKLDHYQLLQIYMAMGGIPHYLKLIEPGQSAVQVIDQHFFSKDGFLKTEFKNLYQSLFDNASNHVAVIRALAKKPKGLTRNEIIKATGLSSGGTTTILLNELEESGFISAYIPFDKNVKDSIYKLSDEYSLFYLKFIEHSRAGKGAWLQLSNSASYASWSGFAFEAVCHKHIGQLKYALGISGVYTEQSAWRHMPPGDGNKGAQVDLLLDRQDRCINLCEIKFSTGEYMITKSYASELENKARVFREQTKTKKSIFLTMITTFGVLQNDYYSTHIQSQLTMEALFKQLS